MLFLGLRRGADLLMDVCRTLFFYQCVWLAMFFVRFIHIACTVLFFLPLQRAPTTCLAHACRRAGTPFDRLNEIFPMVRSTCPADVYAHVPSRRYVHPKCIRIADAMSKPPRIGIADAMSIVDTISKLHSAASCGCRP